MTMKTLAFDLARTVILVTVASVPALAQDDARFDAIARDAARRFAEARRGDTQASPTAPAPGATANLTIDEAVQRALERNLDIAVQRLNPETFDFAIASLRGIYRPTLTEAMGIRDQSQFSTSQTVGADILKTATLTGNTGLTQSLSKGGGNFTLTFNNNRSNQSSTFATRNPTLNANINGALVQPLLRGFRIDGTRSQLLITKLNQEMSEIAVRGVIVSTLSTVRNAYWDLVYAIQAIDVARRSLALASKLVEDNRARVEVGTLAPIDVVQSQSEEALRRQTLVQAEGTRRTLELALKRLLVNGTDDPLWNTSINPVDQPSLTPESLDVQSAVRRALENRSDLQQSKRQLASNEVSIRSLKDLSLPGLDLNASYGIAGVGGPQFFRSGLGGSVTSIKPGGYTDALSSLTAFKAPTWNLFLNLSYPLGNSAAEANLARARVVKQQTGAQVKQLELQIATEVTNTAIQADSSLTRYQAASASRELAQKRLDAEQSKFEVGMSTNFFVVQAQRDLADAQNTALRALIDYRKALVDFQRVQEAPAGGLSSGGISAVR